MSKYAVIGWGLSHPMTRGIAVQESYGMNLISSLYQILATYETLEEAQACAKAIAAFENLPIKSWSL